MYDKLIGMFAVSNLNQIIVLENQLKDIKKNREETVQAYFLRMTKIKNSEVVLDKEMVLNALGGLSRVWETFITTINNINIVPTFDEILGKCIQEEAGMISRGRISHHEEGEPTAFSGYDKRKNGNKINMLSNQTKGI